MIDHFIVFIYEDGIYLILLLVVLKFSVLFWFRPQKPSYAFKKFFTYYDRFRMKEDKMEKWVLFKRINNPLTIIFYILIGLWIITQLLFLIIEKKQ